jgi:hypothetical protein
MNAHVSPVSVGANGALFVRVLNSALCRQFRAEQMRTLQIGQPTLAGQRPLPKSVNCENAASCRPQPWFVEAAG